MAVKFSKRCAIIFTRAENCFLKRRPVHLFGEPRQWVDTLQYLRVILDNRLNWLHCIDQFRMKAAQRLRVLFPLLKRKRLLSIRNGSLRYKKLVRPMMDYACPTCRFAAHNQIRRLQVLTK